MNRTLIAAGCLTAALAMPIAGQSGRKVDLEAADCSRHNMMFGDLAVGRAVQRATVPLTVGQLDVEPEANGGVRLERGSGPNYAITACIGAGAATLAEAQQAADSVRLVIDGNRVRVTGGDRLRNWGVQLVVEAPQQADVTVTTNNGPIGLTGVSGKFELRASNGPIGLTNVQGTVRARAQNGPISVDGSSGEFDVVTSNGPISIALDGQRWDGHLEARATNGPLNVRIPSGYQSGVEVSSSFNSPWSCRMSACRDAKGNRDWDDRSRSLRVGSDPVVVHISTVNGPVTIDER